MFEKLLDKKYIFLGGKGGVGKTSVSSSLATAIARAGKRVCLISTDPAHNLSDAFDQPFSHQPNAVKGVPNLSCIEIDPAQALETVFSKSEGSSLDLENIGILDVGQPSGQKTSSAHKLQSIFSSFPGIDEAMTFHYLTTNKALDEFDLILFDTAPTGHTLRFLSLPDSLSRALAEMDSIKQSLGPLLKTLSMLTSGGGPNNNNPLTDSLSALADEKIFDKLERATKALEQIKQLFKDQQKTTFIAVAIPEFMSLYETERLLEGLEKSGVHCDTIVVNQIIFEGGCEACSVRSKVHSEFLEQFEVLYGGSHRLVKLPVMKFEVRGVEAFEKIGEELQRAFEGK